MRDEMILRKIRKRDPSGLEDLMDRYIPYVSTIVWNILRNCCSKEDAEEVVSDVFVTAWQKAGDVLPGALKAWLGAVPTAGSRKSSTSASSANPKPSTPP